MQEQTTIRIYSVETGEITKVITLTTDIGESNDNKLHQHNVKEYMDVYGYLDDEASTTLPLDSLINQYETTKTKYIEVNF